MNDPKEKTLLDEFAMAALIGLFNYKKPEERTHEALAQDAYEMAHAMMAERSKQKTPS